ncbi:MULTISPECIES: hypothetical protein [Streptomyces]|uniref:Uncharacterized protein n=1 Tax=Streptomyces fuscus TaxID=3048495 RepID=A0ABT7J1F5_9ACTN|nr:MULTISPECIES: hypothetical protein [Streptomyces]MCM1971625.1 hypothetical protein [Streptomyces sp. G1]MDL2078682.1 hypothetical protein [Streptomyces fuscus]SBT90107.1 hypothetical protein GA0115233_101559 [Streptomyces sp. DI166]
MLHRLLFSTLGNPKLIQFLLRCWTVVTDGIARPGVRIAGGVLAAAAGASALAYAAVFRATTDETRRAVEASPDLRGEPGNVMDVLQLLSAVWLVSGIALLVLGLLVALARWGSVLIIVGGVLWWAPLGLLGLYLPTASAPKVLAVLFVALVVPATLLCPAQRFGGARAGATS